MDYTFLPTYISTATTTQIGTGPQILGSIVLGETAAGAITITDGGVTVAVLKASIAEGTYKFNMEIRKSLAIVTAGASKLTVLSKKTSS